MSATGWRMATRTTLKLGVALASVALMLALFEGLLRLAVPRYQYAAIPLFNNSRSRIFSNAKSSRALRRHPDRGDEHLVIFNSLGLRQHREFARPKTPGTLRVGVFGDSFVANLRIPAPYSFTEPLDYLLNRTGRASEVMNFGVDGYGPDQEYLQYLEEGRGLGLDAVVYLFCGNDIRNVLENNLLWLDAQGHLQRVEREPTLLIGLASRLYITYFVLEHSQSLRDRFVDVMYRGVAAEHMARWRAQRFDAVEANFAEGVLTDDVKAALDLCLAIMRQMKRDAEAAGARFFVMLLPAPWQQHDQGFLHFLQAQSFDVLDLRTEFRSVNASRELYKLRKDWHWNEEGNKLAAVFLARFLATRLLNRPIDQALIEQALDEYYSAFDASRVTSQFIHGGDAQVSAETLRGIRHRYATLEADGAP